MFFIQVSFAGVISEIGEKDAYSHWFYRPDYTLTFHSALCSRPGTHHSLSMQPREAVIILNIVPTSYLGYNKHLLQKSSGGNLMKKLSFVAMQQFLVEKKVTLWWTILKFQRLTARYRK